MTTNDPWTAHLEKYDLVELHNEAEHVGYRVRVANGWAFHLEYQAGLPKYQQSGNAIRIFRDTDEGRREARAFLAEVQADIDLFRKAREEEQDEEETDFSDDRSVSHTYDPFHYE